MLFSRIKKSLPSFLKPLLKMHWLMLAAAVALSVMLFASLGALRLPSSELQQWRDALQRGMLTARSADGSFYRVEVDAARPDITRPNIWHLTNPRARARGADDAEALVVLAAPEGELDSKAQVLYLPRAMTLTSTDESDWKMEGERMRIYLREERAASDAAVRVTREGLEIEAGAFAWEHPRRQVIFSGGVRSRLERGEK